MWGGQRQGGIATPQNSSQILIFTNPDSGKRYGYDKFEGLRSDGSYSYTGEGQAGDQVFLRGNRSLRDSVKDGKIIRLFRTRGTQANYVGAFTLADVPYAIEQIPDLEGNERQGIIFNLVPLDADTSELPTYGGEQLNEPQALPWTPPSSDSYEVKPFEPSEVGRTVSRIEFELQADFGAWLIARGDTVRRLRVPVGNTVMEPDLYNETSGEIVEAKKSSARGYVRNAIGQVLDYVHTAQKVMNGVRPSILLPGIPTPDLVELCGGLGITVWVRDGVGFTSVSPTSPPALER
ncbi:hypothetical protein [Subtercola sp. YIM 133946]|uniref:hypothetical protein n=1 Tax=Subtercola sp. YIM 133946 TaxID=3118909 RepID=UPI002F938330